MYKSEEKDIYDKAGAVGKQAVVGAYLCTLPGIGPGFGNDKDNNVIVGTSSQPLRPVAPSSPPNRTSSQGEQLVLQDVPGVSAFVHQVELGDDANGPQA